MSLSRCGVPEGQGRIQNDKRAELKPCPSVYSPAAALRSLSSVALSSEQARGLYHNLNDEIVNFD